MTPAMFATVAREVFDTKTGYSNKTISALDNEICESLIGTLYEVCSELWNLISPTYIVNLQGGHPKHLLWALLFLKYYCIEPILTRVVGGVMEKHAFRKWWAWLFVGVVSVNTSLWCKNDEEKNARRGRPPQRERSTRRRKPDKEAPDEE
jgi:hypothetical protein